MEGEAKISEKLQKKMLRKQIRSKSILLKHEGLTTVDYPTNCLYIGNAGLICGFTRERLMEIFSPFGTITDVVMVPDKPYAFVVYHEANSAVQAMAHVNSQNFVSESNTHFHMCYIEEVPKKIMYEKKLPPGLILLEDFITEEEEKELILIANFQSSEKSDLKHRKVQHFGYEFNYNNNNVNKDKPLEEKIPSICYKYIQRLIALGCISRMPDQLTLNSYAPGQGIPPHIDTHSAFEDEIISLSLGSQVIMDFYHKDKEHIPVLLPRRSVIIMTGESRYLWKHGITPRKTDVVPLHDKSGSHLTLKYRESRISFTFRTIRKGPCNCEYHQQCDSVKEKRLENVVTEQCAEQLEKLYVQEVYENIAEHFSNTRYKPWQRVKEFVQSLPCGSVVLDVGCGNGKNMKANQDCFIVGCDLSFNLAKMCYEQKLQVIVADCLNLPFKDNCADACICIAVIHHMATKLRRLHAVKEIKRVLKQDGTALIYVWALEQETSEGPSKYLCPNKVSKKHKEGIKVLKELDDSVIYETCGISESDHLIKMPVHENRTHFVQQDVLVPWHKGGNSNKESSNEVYHRYYHVFSEGELDSLILECDVEILNSFYDNGNWCVLFKKR